MDIKRAAFLAAAGVTALLGTACEDPDLDVPLPDEVESYYSIGAEHAVTVRGNVAELEVEQQPRQLARGGRLWAKVGPYVFLFSEGTRNLFRDYPGLAAVRVVTRSADGEEIARATLERGALNELTWRRALNIQGLARRDGTKRPTRLEDLVEWGEEHTRFEYSAAFVGSL